MAKGQTSNSEALTVVRVRKALRSGEARELRVRAGLSQNEAARAIGVHELTVSDWERGRNAPRFDAALAYARFLESLREVVTEPEGGWL